MLSPKMKSPILGWNYFSVLPFSFQLFSDIFKNIALLMCVKNNFPGASVRLQPATCVF